jgi:hypothetical protein
MVADAVKHITHTIIMLGVMRRKVGGLAGYGVAGSLARSLLAAAVTGLAAYLTASAVMGLGIEANGAFLNMLALVLAAGMAGLLAYGAMVMALNITEMKTLPSLLRRR